MEAAVAEVAVAVADVAVAAAAKDVAAAPANAHLHDPHRKLPKPLMPRRLVGSLGLAG